MPQGTISGIEKNWTDQEVKEAAQAGLFLKPTPVPAATTTPTTTTTPVAVTPKPITTPVSTTPVATGPVTTAGTPAYDFGKTPEQNKASGIPVTTTPTGTTGVGITPASGVGFVPPSTGGGGSGGGGGGGGGTTNIPIGTTGNIPVVPVPDKKPITQTAPATVIDTSVSLRDLATSAGLVLGNNGNIPTINGIEINPAAAGLQLVNGAWVGTVPQIASAIGYPVEMRTALQAQGKNLEYDPATGVVKVDTIPIATGNMVNLNGRYYTTEANLKRIIEATSAKQPPLVDVATETGLISKTESDLMKRLDDLQKKLDAQGVTPIKEIDYTAIKDAIAQLGQYKSSWNAQLAQLIGATLASKFNYDPNTDKALANALEYADRTVREQMNARGILGSSITRDHLDYIRTQMLPQYEQLALQKYNENLGLELKKIGVLQSLDETDYNRYKEFVMTSINALSGQAKNVVDTAKDNLTAINNQLIKQIEIEKERVNIEKDTIKTAWDRVAEIGYVDNQASLVLDLPVGTLSKTAREAMAKKYDDAVKAEALFSQKIEEQKQKAKDDQQKLDAVNKEKQRVLDDKKKVDDELKAQEKKYAAYVVKYANVPAEKALKEVAEKWETIAEETGPYAYKLYDVLNARKQEEIKNRQKEADLVREDRRIGQEDERISISRETKAEKAEKAEEKEEEKAMTPQERAEQRAYWVRKLSELPLEQRKAYMDDKAVKQEMQTVLMTGYDSFRNEVLGKPDKQVTTIKQQIEDTKNAIKNKNK